MNLRLVFTQFSQVYVNFQVWQSCQQPSLIFKTLESKSDKAPIGEPARWTWNQKQCSNALAVRQTSYTVLFSAKKLQIAIPFA